MFARLRGWFETWKQNLFESYEPPKPNVYKIGNKKYVKVKRIMTKSRSKGPFLK